MSNKKSRIQSALEKECISNFKCVAEHDETDYALHLTTHLEIDNNQRLDNQPVDYNDQEIHMKDSNRVSRGTDAQRKRNKRNNEAEAQIIVTGTLDMSKENKNYIKKYQGSIANQEVVDELPQHAKTLDARREHRKREINLARLSKIEANTSGPTLSEQREIKDFEYEAESDILINRQINELEQERYAEEQRRHRIEHFFARFDCDDNDRREEMRVYDANMTSLYN
jgi:hypothetical protein